MRILLIHNYYQRAGGEDVVVAAESKLLTSKGHCVEMFTESNSNIGRLGWFAAINTIWSQSSYQALKKKIAEFKPDIVHIHNTFMMLSPSVYYACADSRVPIVQTLHNYRLLCANGFFYRDNKVCETCLYMQSNLPSIRYACYRNSRLQTSVVASMLSLHRWLGTWEKKIDCFIALTNFAQLKFVEGGLSYEKITVKPNFVVDSGTVSPHIGEGLFVGRLSPEKGLGTLLEALSTLTNISMRVVGDGPLVSLLNCRINSTPGSLIRHIGVLSRQDVLVEMRNARWLVFPSEWYEGFPMTIVEAFSCGLPVIASRLGSISELVRDGITGLHFSPGDPKELANKICWAHEHPEEMGKMGKAARLEYEEKYTAEKNYEMLIAIYERVIATYGGRSQ